MDQLGVQTGVSTCKQEERPDARVHLAARWYVVARRAVGLVSSRDKCGNGPHANIWEHVKSMRPRPALPITDGRAVLASV